MSKSEIGVEKSGRRLEKAAATFRSKAWRSEAAAPPATHLVNIQLRDTPIDMFAEYLAWQRQRIFSALGVPGAVKKGRED